jgi:hypothetical protein
MRKNSDHSKYDSKWVHIVEEPQLYKVKLMKFDKQSQIVTIVEDLNSIFDRWNGANCNKE